MFSDCLFAWSNLRFVLCLAFHPLSFLSILRRYSYYGYCHCIEVYLMYMRDSKQANSSYLTDNVYYYMHTSTWQKQSNIRMID